jgi:hypothetical protein
MDSCQRFSLLCCPVQVEEKKHRVVSFRSQILNRNRPEGLIQIYIQIMKSLVLYFFLTSFIFMKFMYGISKVIPVSKHQPGGLGIKTLGITSSLDGGQWPASRSGRVAKVLHIHTHTHTHSISKHFFPLWPI